MSLLWTNDRFWVEVVQESAGRRGDGCYKMKNSSLVKPEFGISIDIDYMRANIARDGFTATIVP